VWGTSDEHYFAMIADKSEAEGQVRDAAQVTGQGSVEAVRPLTADEVVKYGLLPHKIIFAPKGMH